MENSLLSELRREREARAGTLPASSAPPPPSHDGDESPAAKKHKAAKPEVIDLLESDDDDVPAISSDEQLAWRLQAEENERGTMASAAAAAAPSSSFSSSSAITITSSSNPLGLDLSRVEILRLADPTPVVLIRGVGGELERLARSMANFEIPKDRRSNRKCGAAENTGTNGKNSDNTFHPLAETNTEYDHKCKQVTRAQRGEWIRVLQYDAPVLKAKREGNQFHRHLDHGMYGWVVLASLHASCDFYVRLGPRPPSPVCECGLPCRLAKFAKEGPNLGRFYHCCRGQYNKCKTFAWAKEGDETPSNERGSSSRTAIC